MYGEGESVENSKPGSRGRMAVKPVCVCVNIISLVMHNVVYVVHWPTMKLAVLHHPTTCTRVHLSSMAKEHGMFEVMTYCL